MFPFPKISGPERVTVIHVNEVWPSLMVTFIFQCKIPYGGKSHLMQIGVWHSYIHLKILKWFSLPFYNVKNHHIRTELNIYQLIIFQLWPSTPSTFSYFYLLTTVGVVHSDKLSAWDQHNPECLIWIQAACLIQFQLPAQVHQGHHWNVKLKQTFQLCWILRFNT